MLGCATAIIESQTKSKHIITKTASCIRLRSLASPSTAIGTGPQRQHQHRHSPFSIFLYSSSSSSLSSSSSTSPRPSKLRHRRQYHHRSSARCFWLSSCGFCKTELSNQLGTQHTKEAPHPKIPRVVLFSGCLLAQRRKVRSLPCPHV